MSVNNWLCRTVGGEKKGYIEITDVLPRNRKRSLNKLKLYSNPWVQEVIDFREGGNALKPMKCLNCHKRPCICKEK